MNLATFWFILIAILWTGYFVLEGFDSGVGILLPFLGREGWAFAGTAVTIAIAVATLFGDLWPNVLPATTRAAYSLTVDNASSAHYALLVMTWVALIFTPVVLLYQGWTYWVFRKRLTRSDTPAAPAPSGTPSGGRGPGPQVQAIHGES